MGLRSQRGRVGRDRSTAAPRVGSAVARFMLGSLAAIAVIVIGGFFALRSQIFDYLNPGEELVIEAFSRLVEKRQVLAVPHDGFWQNMDTFKDKLQLDEMVSRGHAPWQVWDDPSRD